MLRRDGPASAGPLIREVLEPIADALGIDYDLSTFESPVSDEAIALEAYRCGLDLLMAFTYVDGWVTGDAQLAGKRQGRQAARRVLAALPTAAGRSAVSHMTQQYGTAMGAMWRQAAHEREHPAQVDQLLHSAEASESLAALAARHWPVEDPYAAVARVAAATNHRLFDPDTADATIDLRSYAERAEATSQALGIALGARLDDFENCLIAPVMTLQLIHNTALLADWTYVANFWTNLMMSEPMSRHDLVRTIVAERDAH